MYIYTPIIEKRINCHLLLSIMEHLMRKKMGSEMREGYTVYIISGEREGLFQYINNKLKPMI